MEGEIYFRMSTSLFVNTCFVTQTNLRSDEYKLIPMKIVHHNSAILDDMKEYIISIMQS